MIFDDQNAASVQRVGRCPFGAASSCRRRRYVRGIAFGARQPDRERRAVPFTRAHRPHGAAVQFDDVPHDGQAEAEPSESPRRRRVGLPEPVEDEGQHIGSDADAGVLNLEFDGVLDIAQRYDDPAVGAGELDRVRQDVPEHLLEPIRVADHRRGDADPLFEPNPLGVHRRPERVDRRANDRANVDRLDGQRHLCLHDSRDVEHFFDEPKLRVGIALDHFNGVSGALVQIPASQNARPAVDGIQRRPELVRQRVQEFVLETIRLLDLAIQLDAIERETNAASDFLDNERIRSGISSRVRRKERQHASNLAVDNERQHRGRRRAEALCRE